MKIRKFEHACFAVEQNGQSIIVDPGNWTTNLVIPDDVVAVLITHEHPDHYHPDNIQAIVDKNPSVVIVAHESIVSQLDDYTTQSVVSNEGIKIGEFALEFFGGEHAIISPGMPIIHNLGVMINNMIYYPGDSFTLPDDKTVNILALPVAAPWMKFSEAAAFLSNVHPITVFPTHDAILSSAGKTLADTMMKRIADGIDTVYKRIDDTPLEA